MRKFLPFFSVFLSTALLLGGCAPAVFLGGSGLGVVTQDERTYGSFLEDQEIEIKASLALSEEVDDLANVSVTSYNRSVLLTGQVVSEDVHRKVLDIFTRIKNVRDIHDQLTVSGLASLASRAADSALTAKVKANLCALQIESFSCLDVKIVSEQGVVYMLGLVTKKQAAVAVEETRDIKGVQKVVKVFEVVE